METTYNKYTNLTGLDTEGIPCVVSWTLIFPTRHPPVFSPMSKPQPLQCPHHCCVQNIPRVLRCRPGAASATQLHYLLYFGKQCELKPSLEGCASNQEGMNNFHQTPLYFMSRFCHLVWTKIHLMNTTLRHGASLLARLFATCRRSCGWGHGQRSERWDRMPHLVWWSPLQDNGKADFSQRHVISFVPDTLALDFISVPLSMSGSIFPDSRRRLCQAQPREDEAHGDLTPTLALQEPQPSLHFASIRWKSPPCPF